MFRKLSITAYGVHVHGLLVGRLDVTDDQVVWPLQATKKKAFSFAMLRSPPRNVRDMR